MYREHQIEVTAPELEDFWDHAGCSCEYCRPDEWPPVDTCFETVEV